MRALCRETSGWCEDVIGKAVKCTFESEDGKETSISSRKPPLSVNEDSQAVENGWNRAIMRPGSQEESAI